MASFLPRLASTPLKIAAGCFFILALAAIICLYFLPTLLSTSWGQNQIISRVNSRIPGSVTMKHLELHWSGVQHIEDLILKDPEGQVVFHIPKLDVEASLTHLIFNANSLTAPLKLNLKGMQGKITRTSQGSSNLHQALNIQTSSRSAAPFSIEFANVDAILDLKDRLESFDVQLTGEVLSSGKKGKLEIHSLVKEGLLPENFTVKLIQFPIPLIEEFISLFQPNFGNNLSLYAGSTLDAELNHAKDPQGDRLQLTAKTPKIDLDLSTLLTQEDKNGLHLNNISGTLKTQFSSLKESPHSGQISGDIAIANWMQNGQLNLKGADIVAKILLSDFPAEALSHIQKLEALPLWFGKMLTVNLGYISKENALNFKLNGSNGSVIIESQLHDGIATLTKPLQAELKVTPELGQHLLQDLIPILGGIVSAENYLTLTLDPKGFSYPINSRNFYDAEIGSLTLNLGKVFFSSKGQFGKIASLLNAKTPDEISVWFTPIYLDMHNGKIQIKRFDMLVVNKFPLASWGTVDFPKDKIHLTLGLSGKSLESYIKVPISDETSMLQVPYKGKIGKASLDKTKLAAQVAALVSASSGTPQGLGLGALLGLASGAFSESPPPPPTTQPFPWNTQSNF